MKGIVLPIVIATISSFSPSNAVADAIPVKVGLSAEFGHRSSTSAEAVRKGILTAIDEINEAGGVLNGRPLVLEVRDNRSVPARGVADLAAFANDENVVAVFGGKFSTVMLDMVPKAHELRMPLLDPWAAADKIVDNGFEPNFAFRLSLKDGWAMPAMIDYTISRGLTNLALLLPNNGWGRSSKAAVSRHLEAVPDVRIVGTSWYNWGDEQLAHRYGALISAGAEAILMVANETEGADFVRAAFNYDPDKRVPLISHWGITGGDFVGMTAHMLTEVDLTVVQTFTFVGRNDMKTAQVLDRAYRLFDFRVASDIHSPVGFAHAYDLTHILARAVDKAGSVDRAEIRSALEMLGEYAGLVRHYDRPFAPDRHEALRSSDVFLGRFNRDGTISMVSE